MTNEQFHKASEIKSQIGNLEAMKKCSDVVSRANEILNEEDYIALVAFIRELSDKRIKTLEEEFTNL